MEDISEDLAVAIGDGGRNAEVVAGPPAVCDLALNGGSISRGWLEAAGLRTCGTWGRCRVGT